MAYHYNTHNENHDLARNLAHRLSRETRHGGPPTQYIVNEGKMIVDQRTLRHSNAIIYNAPGSTLRFAPSKPVPARKSKHDSYYTSGSYGPTTTTAPPLHMCRGCGQRETYYGGFCHDCTSLWYSQRDRDNRYLTRASDRNLVGWR
ncbi:hypothetical protein GGS26DRAFT_507460 [Hypomontagnella submonticulosa]|nr:hypothetical protein GGS26DRAFT_507460 [Hypomontagnella submonticulosa]